LVVQSGEQVFFHPNKFPMQLLDSLGVEYHRGVGLKPKSLATG